MLFRDGLGGVIGVDEVVTECPGEIGILRLLDGDQAVLNCAAGDTFHHTDLGLHVVSGPDPANNGETQKVFFPWTSVISLRTLTGVRYYISQAGDPSDGELEYKKVWVYPIPEPGPTPEPEKASASQLYI